MPNVKITKKEIEIEQNVRLRNGDLIVYENHVALVVSNESSSSHCTFIDLETGQRLCAERCSRDTTRKRIASHLRMWVGGSYRSTDVQTSKSVKYNKLEVYSKNQYDIDITIKTTAQSMCFNAMYCCSINDEIEVEPEGERCPHCGEILSAVEEKKETEKNKNDF